MSFLRDDISHECRNNGNNNNNNNNNNLFLIEREIHEDMQLRALQAPYTFSAAKVPAAFEDKIRIPVRSC